MDTLLQLLVIQFELELMFGRPNLRKAHRPVGDVCFFVVGNRQKKVDMYQEIRYNSILLSKLGVGAQQI